MNYTECIKPYPVPFFTIHGLSGIEHAGPGPFVGYAYVSGYTTHPDRPSITMGTQPYATDLGNGEYNIGETLPLTINWPEWDCPEGDVHLMVGERDWPLYAAVMNEGMLDDYGQDVEYALNPFLEDGSMSPIIRARWSANARKRLGLEYDEAKLLPATVKHAKRQYVCMGCGQESLIGTNHYGDIYSGCSCGHNHWVCTAEKPANVVRPQPWRQCKLGDVADVKLGGK